MSDEMNTDLFTSLPAVDPETTARLHARLVTAAQQAGLVDVAYRTLDSPVGELLLAATQAGLVRVAFTLEDHQQVLAELADQVSPRLLHAPARLDEVARELDQYFAGTRTRFDLPLDFRLSAGFRREVLARLIDIPYGATASYADIARRAGSPRASRAVGTACATNPLPLIVPCHRVIRSDGSVGNYGGGTDAKLALLALEATGGGTQATEGGAQVTERGAQITGGGTQATERDVER
jgi:methylated-DNA-[protein]-cysteine S-methyltransferase